MSATGRNLAGAERRPDDFYATPAWCVRAIEPYLPDRGGTWIEPCVGSGAIVAALHPRMWWTCDIEQRGNEQPCHLGSYLSFETPALNGVRCLITNPPFSLAEEFIRKARQDFPHTPSFWLLRLNFLGSRKRLQLWADVGTPDIYVLPKRPSFSDNGKTDATEYAWFGFRPDSNGSGSIRILQVSP